MAHDKLSKYVVSLISIFSISISGCESKLDYLLKIWIYRPFISRCSLSTLSAFWFGTTLFTIHYMFVRWPHRQTDPEQHWSNESQHVLIFDVCHSISILLSFRSHNICKHLQNEDQWKTIQIWRWRIFSFIRNGSQKNSPAYLFLISPRRLFADAFWDVRFTDSCIVSERTRSPTSILA